MELPDRGTCYRALQSRDTRFDGLIFVGVSSTGVYCRPVCPARTPKFQHCRFFASAAAAHDAGFRPCLRCRPETAPDLASRQGAPRPVARALELIADGALDGRRSGVDQLAARLGLGERHLRRLFVRHLGASPASVARTRRVLFARQLILDTCMPMTGVAMASGFGSLRRFNEVFQGIFHRAPSALRRAGVATADDHDVTLRLRYRAPYDWQSMLGFLRARAITGVEVVDDERYYRTTEIHGEFAGIEVSHRPDRNGLDVRILVPNVRLLPAIVGRVRRLFDLGADIATINRHLAADPWLAPSIARHPGLRAPGGWDGFEIAVRAILGQQITVAAARRYAGQLVAKHGPAVPDAVRIHARLTHVFPTPERLAANPVGLAMPAARLRALQAMALAAIADPDLFLPSADIDATIAKLLRIPGIGPWTAQYIALRAVRETDAFPATDGALLRIAAALHRDTTSSAALLTRAESWRPWRAYAAQHLWSVDGDRATLAPASPPRQRPLPAT
jgi:AraC family transcriptional regulator, regulatory protein of adaptative response / DNA-3-methyladenine glycosylase II